MEGGFSASLHLYISIAKRLSLTILPDVHMYKAVPSNFRVAFMGSFPTKKCGDGNRCSVGEGCWFFLGFFVFYHKWMTSHNFLELPVQLLFHFV
jgi:hypothetical protein